MKIDLKIPNLGEAEDTEIIEVSVSAGEKIKKNARYLLVHLVWVKPHY